MLGAMVERIGNSGRKAVGMRGGHTLRIGNARPVISVIVGGLATEGIGRSKNPP